MRAILGPYSSKISLKARWTTSDHWSGKSGSVICNTSVLCRSPKPKSVVCPRGKLSPDDVACRGA
eukprot:12935687-Prorocentrum_lima.AAC.1